jgi:chromosome segregation ATPase
MFKKFPWLKYVIAGIAVLVLIIYVGRSCSIGGKYSRLKAEYETYRAIAREDGARMTALIETKTAEIRALTARIAALLEAASQPTEAEVEKDAEIAALKAQVAALEAQGDVAGALAAAKDEIAAWEVRFSLADERHRKSIFDLNAAWQAKYDAQVSISETWKKQYENEHTLRLVGEKLTGTLEGKVKRLQLVGKAKSIVVIAAAGYVGYTLLQGKSK